MITRHHLALSLICGLIPCTLLAGKDPILIMAVLAGIGIGSILPDIHMKRPSKIRLLTAAWGLIGIGRILIAPIMCLCYTIVAGISTTPNDKRLTHSVPGIFLYWALFTSPLLATGILYAGTLFSEILLIISGSLLAGMCLHLAQDLCTRKGIVPLYPFTDLNVHGSIRPCDVHDPRIFRFHIQHAVVFLVVQIILTFAILPSPFLVCCGFISAMFCVILMAIQSDVHTRQEAGSLSTAGEGANG